MSVGHSTIVIMFQVHLMDEFDILQIVGEGWFGKILLVEHRATDTEMVLKGMYRKHSEIKFYKPPPSNLLYRHRSIAEALCVHSRLLS